MKKFLINCDIQGQKSPLTIFIGLPQKQHHPLHFQMEWLAKNRGLNIPGEVVSSIEQLQNIASKNNILLEELCVYALEKNIEEEKEEISLEEEIFDELLSDDQ
ncbi:MAG TPA: DUF2610 domain-containing protein [Candidatus Megaira endosymbiont of Hartmannula sinica]|nr:DUF2610 domain-containing protein [Candidatus Megaera endosymbiont of Hartmannula sinica]